MEEFVRADIRDVSLPFSLETLPGFLKDENLRRAFLDYQVCVLTDARKLEFSEDHIHFQESAEEHVSSALSLPALMPPFLSDTCNAHDVLELRFRLVECVWSVTCALNVPNIPPCT
jgi:hypothetical protein